MTTINCLMLVGILCFASCNSEPPKKEESVPRSTIFEKNSPWSIHPLQNGCAYASNLDAVYYLCGDKAKIVREKVSKRWPRSALLGDTIKTIDVPGVGEVDFPSSMSEREIAEALKRDIFPPLADSLAASTRSR